MKSATGWAGSQLTVRDVMILVAGAAVSFWITPEHLSVGILKILDSVVRNPSVRLTLYRISRVLSDPVQPIVAVWTLTILVLTLSRRRGPVRRLACQPGFVACSSAALAILIVGSLNLITLKVNTVDGLPLSVYAQVYLGKALTFDRAECGIAVAAAWLTLFLGGRWRSRPDWVDWCGRVLGCFWIAMIPATRLGHLILLMR